MTGLPFTGTGISKLQDARGTQQRHNYTNGHHKVPQPTSFSIVLGSFFFVDVSEGCSREKREDLTQEILVVVSEGRTQQLVRKKSRSRFEDS